MSEPSQKPGMLATFCFALGVAVWVAVFRTQLSPLFGDGEDGMSLPALLTASFGGVVFGIAGLTLGARLERLKRDK